MEAGFLGPVGAEDEGWSLQEFIWKGQSQHTEIFTVVILMSMQYKKRYNNNNNIGLPWWSSG